MANSAAESRARAVLLGLKDESTRSEPVEDIAIPTHLPYFFGFAEKGDSKPTLVASNGATQKYGSRTFTSNTEFATHQTPYINLAIANGNPIIYERLLPEGAKTAFVRISAEIIRADLPVYERNYDGSIKYASDNYGERIPVIKTNTTGYRVVIHAGVAPWQSDSWTNTHSTEVNTAAVGFGGAEKITGYREGSTKPAGANSSLGLATDTSTIYPIMDIPVSSAGSHGNNVGLRIQLPHTGSTTPIDLSTVIKNFAYTPRFGIVTRKTTTESYNVVESNLGEITTDVCFKDGAVKDLTNVRIGLESQFARHYVTSDYGTIGDLAGPLTTPHVYHDNLNELLGILAKSEEAYNSERAGYGSLTLSESKSHLINFLGGFDERNIPYFTIDVGSSSVYGGLTMSNDTVIYATGGDDGLAKDAKGDYDKLAITEQFDKMVQQKAKGFGTSTGGINYENYAKYPFSVIYDTGFTIDTKRELLNILDVRKDVAVILGTFSWADYKTTVNAAGEVVKVFTRMPNLSKEEEIAVGGILQAAAAMHPESEAYGTSTCRAMVFMYTGEIIDSTYTDRVSASYDFLNKASLFMGNTNQVWNDAYAMDVTGNNVITTLKNMSNGYLVDGLANSAWGSGLVACQDYDMKRLFTPAYRTVYNKPTSVMNSAITMFAVLLCERTAHKAWRYLVGNSKWGDERFIQESNRIIKDELANVFDDGRFQIKVDTKFTSTDKLLGYQWTTEIILYASNMRTVGRYTVISRRLQDYKSEA